MPKDDEIIMKLYMEHEVPTHSENGDTVNADIDGIDMSEELIVVSKLLKSNNSTFSRKKYYDSSSTMIACFFFKRSYCLMNYCNNVTVTVAIGRKSIFKLNITTNLFIIRSTKFQSKNT